MLIMTIIVLVIVITMVIIAFADTALAHSLLWRHNQFCYIAIEAAPSWLLQM